MSSNLTIGQFAELAGVSARALRIYETHGLVKSQLRGENGYRYYSDTQLESVQRVKKLKALGFSLREIRAMVLGDLSLDLSHIRDFIQQKIDLISRAEEELASQKRQLNSILQSIGEDQEVPITKRRMLMKFFESELPFISVRDLVIFPGSLLSLYIGRNFSKAAVADSLAKHGGQIIVGSQKAVEMNDKPDPDQIYEVGCLCQIKKREELEDSTLKVTLEASSRWHIINLKDVENVRLCEGAILPYPTNAELSPDRRSTLVTILNKRSELKEEPSADPFTFVNQVGGQLHHLLSHESSRDTPTTGPNPFLIDAKDNEVNAKINLNIARIQEVLTEDDPEAAVQKLVYLLG